MTRYARAGRGTHQRVAKDSTPWDELKPPSPERKRGSEGHSKSKTKERFNKHSGKSNDTNDSNSSNPEGSKNFKKGNANIRGFGQSRSVKLFGQFWVPIEDAKRLKNLLQKLKSQGLPRKEILEILKNDRRKAEKAAKRQRDKTCFQCRQFGHVLSDCPNLKKAIAKPGSEEIDEEDDSAIPNDSITDEGLVCFKCGSTEHTSRKCRRKGENFEFAKCFICSGSGHIARQCPKNERGIYPSGGSCGECGSTAHLKKDCPDLVGVEGETLSKDESDAVALSVSDPYASTEYEPVFEFEEAEAGKPAEDVTDETPVVARKTATKKKKNNNKRKNREVEDATFEFDVEPPMSSTAKANQKLFSSDPKKRKVVKF